MKRKGNRGGRILIGLAAASMPAFAWATPTTSNWIAGSSDWNTPGNWNPVGVPSNGNYVDIVDSDAVSRTITYDYNGSAATLVGLFLYDNGGGTENLSMANGGESLTADAEYIGGYFLSSVNGASIGAMSQSAGTNSVGLLDLGFIAGDNGRYSLSGTGLLDSGTIENIGLGGTGTFVQAGGTNSFAADNSFLNVGANAGSLGNYFLSSGALAMSGASGNEVVGVSGSGTFTQNGGSNATSVLSLGGNAGSTGTYVMNGLGSLTLSASTEFVGNNGVGIFSQISGVNTVSGDLYVGNGMGSTGSYTLSGFSTFSLAANNEYVGYNGSGSIFQNSGTNAVSASLILGNSNGASGSYSLAGSAGTLTANGSSSAQGIEYVGDYGTGFFNQSGGSNQTTYMYLGNAPDSTGTYLLSSSGSLSVTVDLFVGQEGTGTFIQSGGTNIVTYSLLIGASGGSSGAYTLSAGTLRVGILGEIVGGFSPGTFNQTGGSNTALEDGLYVGEGATGTYNLSGTGSLTIGTGSPNSNANEYVGYGDPIVSPGVSNGTFNQTGGTHTITGIGSLYLGYNAGATGTYLLSSGSLSVNDYLGVGYSGVGIFNQTGGTNSVTDLAVGGNEGTGTYVLSGTASLTATSEFVGAYGTGTFTQNGGTNSAFYLYLGQPAAGIGYYILNGGAIMANDEEIGTIGAGIFNQTGGTNLVEAERLSLADNPGSTGFFILSGTGSVSAPQVNVGGTINGAGGEGVLTIGGGSFQVSGALLVSNSSGSGVNMNGGVLTAATLNLLGGHFTQSGGSATFSQITGTGIVAITGGKTILSGSGTASQVNSLTLSGPGTLDVTNYSLTINYGTGNQSPILAIQSYLKTGYNGGAWNGAGIDSSAVAALNASQSRLIYGIGYADGADGIVPNLSSGEIEIVPTLAGDAKLQGNVVFGDFQLLSQYFGLTGSWDEGNFHYGSAVDFGDFQLLSQNFGATSSALTGGELASLNGFAAQFGDRLEGNAGGGFSLVSVPEPVSAGLLALGGVVFLNRRRRQK